MIDQLFPALGQEGFVETSPATRVYNCIAWAAGQTDAWWWPDALHQYPWPASAARAETLPAFAQAFASLGYEPCDGGELEPGFEKVALYAVAGKPTHAARQLADGRWTSKLGRWIDISHSFRGLEGSAYGNVAAFLKRPRRAAADLSAPPA